MLRSIATILGSFVLIVLAQERPTMAFVILISLYILFYFYAIKRLNPDKKMKLNKVLKNPIGRQLYFQIINKK